MSEKTDSNQLFLATIAILGPPPRYGISGSIRPEQNRDIWISSISFQQISCITPNDW